MQKPPKMKKVQEISRRNLKVGGFVHAAGVEINMESPLRNKSEVLFYPFFSPFGPVNPAG